MDVFNADDAYLLFDATTNTGHYLSSSLHRVLSCLDRDTEATALRMALIQNGVDESDVSAMFRSGLFQLVSLKTHLPSNKPAALNIAISPNSGCNLACHYCYSKAPIKRDAIKKETYTIAIRQLLKAVVESPSFFMRQLLGETQMVNLTLMGGGEPTLNPALFIDIINTFKVECDRCGVEPHFFVVSNGTFDEAVLTSISKHKMRVMLSLDGYADVQDFQRPYRDGTKTFPVVINNIRRLVSEGCELQIRATVTGRSISCLTDIVDLSKEEAIKVIHFEPQSWAGMAISSGAPPVYPSEFSTALVEAFIYAFRNNIAIRSNCLPITNSRRESFCGACGTNRIVTPTGYISSCVEVTDINDELSDTFIIGKVTPNKGDGFELWRDRISVLNRRQLRYMNACESCFLRFNCAGNCLAKALRENDDMFKPVDDWCEASRNLSINILKGLLL